MLVNTDALELLQGNWTCHKCGSRKFHPRESASLRCEKCETVNFESCVHFNRVLKNEDTPPAVKKYLRSLLRKDWPKCEHCKRRFKAIDKHVTRKHDQVLFRTPTPELL